MYLDLLPGWKKIVNLAWKVGFLGHNFEIKAQNQICTRVKWILNGPKMTKIPSKNNFSKKIFFPPLGPNSAFRIHIKKSKYTVFKLLVRFGLVEPPKMESAYL